MRIPRPCRLKFVSVRSVTRECGIGHATANSLHHGESEAVFIGERVIFGSTIVEPKHLLIDVPFKVERLNCNVGPVQSTLQQGPEVLHPVRVNFATNIFVHMIHGLMNEILLRRAVRSSGIGEEFGTMLYTVQNLAHQRAPLNLVHDLGANLASVAIKHSKDSRLRSVKVESLPFLQVHVARLAADVGFVRFCRAARRSHARHRSRLHRFTNPVEHEPSRLLCNSDRAMQFVTADAVFAVADHPEGCHPLIEADRRVFKNGSDLERELLLASVAEPQFPRLHERVRVRFAAGARNLVFRPTKPFRVFEGSIRVTEVNNCLLESYGLFHLSHHPTKNTVARIDLCVNDISADHPTRTVMLSSRSNVMRVILHDFQDGSDDPFDGVHVNDSDNLRDILNQLQRRDPFILELEGDNGYRLTVGIGGPVSCIQHSSSDGEPPYMVAVMEDGVSRPEETDHVFLCGGQATEIRGRHCVPFSVLQSVACYFLETGDRSQDVDWVPA